MCLILQETLFQVQVQKVLFIKARQLASIETRRAVPTRGSATIGQIGICRGL